MGRVPAEVVPPVAASRGEGVRDGDDSGGGAKCGLKNHRAVHVAPTRRVRASRPDAPVAGFWAQNPREKGTGVEMRQA